MCNGCEAFDDEDSLRGLEVEEVQSVSHHQLLIKTATAPITIIIPTMLHYAHSNFTTYFY